MWAVVKGAKPCHPVGSLPMRWQEVCTAERTTWPRLKSIEAQLLACSLQGFEKYCPLLVRLVFMEPSRDMQLSRS